MESSTLLPILFWTARLLLLSVSVGILYLTAIQWRDRRRQESDRKLKR